MDRFFGFGMGCCVRRWTVCAGLAIVSGWLLVGSAFAQGVPVVTPLHTTWQWTQPGVSLSEVQGWTYELIVDSAAPAPLVGVTCSGTASPYACKATRTSAFSVGRHTARLQGVQIVSTQRLVGPVSADYTFDYTTGPTQPTSLELVITLTGTIKIGQN